MLQTHEGRNPSDPTSLVVWSRPCSSTCRSKTSMVLTLGLRSLGYFLHTACVTRSQQWLKHSNDKKMMQQFRVFVWNKEAFRLTCRCYLGLSRILPLRTCDEPKQQLCGRIQHSYFDTSLNRKKVYICFQSTGTSVSRSVSHFSWTEQSWDARIALFKTLAFLIGLL